jgi:hypothetical protein
MFGLARVVRIGGLMERRLDRERAGLEGGRRAADAVIAFDYTNLAAGLGEQSGSGEPAEAGSDNDRFESVFAHDTPHARVIVGVSLGAQSIRISNPIIDRRQPIRKAANPPAAARQLQASWVSGKNTRRRS